MTILFRLIIVASLVLASVGVRAAEAPSPEGVLAADIVMDPNARVKDFTVQDVPLEAALRILSKQFGLSIITARNVTTDVSATFKDVSLAEALDSLVTINGYAYRMRGAVIEVYSPSGSDGVRVQPEIRTFRLDYANAEKMKAVIKPFLTNDIGKIEADIGGNALIIFDVPASIEGVERILEEVDRPEPQVTISAEIIEAGIDIEDRLGIDWGTQLRASGAARPITFPFDSRTSDSKWIPGNDVTGTDFDAANSFPFPETTDFTFGTLDATGLEIVMEAIRSDDNSTLIANPEITTLNNHEAKINLGAVTPVAEYTTNLETGVSAVTGFIDIETGTILTVTPQVNEEAGIIKMSVKPEISEITGFVGQFDERPIISSRKAETTVRLRDGETLVIGGLVSEQTDEVVNKVPLLGDIPGLRWLFRWEETTVNKNSLYIFVTPRIMGHPEYNDRAKKAGERLERNGLGEVDSHSTDLRNPDIWPFTEEPYR